MTVFKNAAELFADCAHSSIGQKRKYTNEPYIVHPRNVAYLIKIVGGSDEMISAAFLHDVLEDVAPKNQRFNETQIRKLFGDKITNYVLWLTDNIPLDFGNRKQRKNYALERIASAPKEVKTIKLADLIDNSLTICEYDPNFAKVYMPEKRALLEVLKEGDKYLWDMANNILIRHGY